MNHRMKEIRHQMNASMNKWRNKCMKIANEYVVAHMVTIMSSIRMFRSGKWSWFNCGKAWRPRSRDSACQTPNGGSEYFARPKSEFDFRLFFVDVLQGKDSPRYPPSISRIVWSPSLTDLRHADPWYYAHASHVCSTYVAIGFLLSYTLCIFHVVFDTHVLLSH